MALEVKIKKKLADFTLQADFTAVPKEIFGVLGASGCGKSMTLKCIAGIEKPDAGYVALDGRYLFNAQKKIDVMPQQRHIGYLFQSYALFPHMTVAENIAIGIQEKKLRQKLTQQYLQMLFLTECAKRYPHELSGGQQQRAALARIFAAQPQVLLLDEPFAALDSFLKWQVSLELHESIVGYGKPVLFVSHSRDEIYRFCDRIAVIDQGQMEPAVEKAQLFAAPQTLAAAKLTGCKNHSRIVQTQAGIYRALDWQLDLAMRLPLPEQVTHIGIREQKIKIVEAVGEQPNTYQFELVQCLPQINGCILLVRRNPAATVLQVELQGTQKIAGKTVCLQLPAEEIFFLQRKCDVEIK